VRREAEEDWGRCFSDATFLLGGAPFFFVGYLVRCGG
jgi:hypothetical protein